MKAVHLNLLKDSERLSSSPIRLRVMAPILCVLALAGVLAWWGFLYTRILVRERQVGALEAEIAQQKAAYDKVTAKQGEISEIEAQIEQIEYFLASRRTWGETLTALAESIPPTVQLTSLEIPEPPPQKLIPPQGFKGIMWGPTENSERVSFVLAGRTTGEKPVYTMMSSFETGVFTNTLVIAKGDDVDEKNRSPKVKSFRQDTARAGDKSRMQAFEIEYRAKERSFAK